MRHRLFTGFGGYVVRSFMAFSFRMFLHGLGAIYRYIWRIALPALYPADMVQH